MRQTRVINRKKQRLYQKPLLVWSALIVVLVLGTYSVVAHAQDWWPFPESSTNTPAEENAKGETSPSNRTAPDKADINSNDVSNDTSEQVPVSTALSAVITQLEESEGNVLFTAKIQNATAAGNCVVTFTNPADRPITQQSTATLSGSVATCGPISTPSIEFTALGNWTASFHFYSEGQQATAEGTINIK